MVPQPPRKAGGFNQWLWGKERRDPEGYRCRVGALWTHLFLWRGYAIVLAQTVWIAREETWAQYLRNDFWRAHEHHHFVQEREYFGGNTVRYALAFVWQYARHMSHDKAPLEIEANEAAARGVEAKKQAAPPTGE
jgi:hypothetical protein